MGKTAIVLGGTAGVGHAVVQRLLAAGHSVGIVARGEERLETLATEHGARVATVSADVADWTALEAAVGELVERLGTPEIWVNNAMATSFSPFSEVEPDEFERIVAVTLFGQVNGTRLALRHMARGRIICVGSGLGYRSVPFQAAYCSAKHGINGFVSSVRSELLRAGSKVSIHLVQLPAINTPQFDWALNRLDRKPQPAPPIYAPEVAADAVMRAIEQGPRELLVGKSVLQLTFGNFVMPDWLDRKLAKSGVESQKSERAPEGGEDNLHEPVAYPASAEGSYGDRAAQDALVIDGDRARLLLFGGAVVAALVVGLLLGLILG